MERKRTIQYIKCPICGESLKILPTQRGEIKNHVWVWDLAHPTLGKRGIRYPLYIYCPNE